MAAEADPKQIPYVDRKIDADYLIDSKSVSWESVKLQDNLKRKIIEIILLPFLCPAELLDEKILPPNILIYGAAGIGKSMLIKSFPNFLEKYRQGYGQEVSIYRVMGCDFMLRYSPNNRISDLFNRARDMSPSIVVLDELESVFLCGGDDKRIQKALIKEMTDKSPNKPLIIGVTNRPLLLPQEFIDNFDEKIYIPLPSVTENKTILQSHISELGQTPDYINFDIDRIADKINGWTGADISSLVRSVSSSAVSFVVNAKSFKKIPNTSSLPSEREKDMYAPCSPSDPEGQKFDFSDLETESTSLYIRPITVNDIEENLKRGRSTVSQAELEQFEKWTRVHAPQDWELKTLNLKLMCRSAIQDALSWKRIKLIPLLPLPMELKRYLAHL